MIELKLKYQSVRQAVMQQDFSSGHKPDKCRVRFFKKKIKSMDTQRIDTLVSEHKWQTLIEEIPFGESVLDLPDRKAFMSLRATAYLYNMFPEHNFKVRISYSSKTSRLKLIKETKNENETDTTAMC